MARHCIFSDHCQRDNIAHLWKLLHTFGSNTAHLHTVWKIKHTSSLYSCVASYNNEYGYIIRLLEL